MSDFILKGKGVYAYSDAEGEEGVMVPHSLPPKESDHEGMSHFHINSRTGKPFKQLKPQLLGRFPMEIAAGVLAREMEEQGKGGLEKARKIFNDSVARFNKIKRDSGDDFHTLPMPFDQDGSLHPEYKNNHYGTHESRSVPSPQRRTRTEDGRLINNHTNNKAHPTLGIFLESAALHFHKELRDLLKQYGINSSIGARQNVIEPQQITGGVTRRYHSNEEDPTSKENTTFPSHFSRQHADTAAYGEISPMSIVSVLPNDFFVPSARGGMSTDIMNQFMEMGYDQPTARQMARAPVNQLLYGRGKGGSPTGLRIVMNDMKDKLQLDRPEIRELYTKHRSHFSPRVRGGDRGRNRAAIDILSMMMTAKELGIDTDKLSSRSAAPKQIYDNYVNIASGQTKQFSMDDLVMADNQHPLTDKTSNDYTHLHDAFPAHLSGGTIGAELNPPDPVLPPQDPITTMPADNVSQLPLEGDPLADAGGSAGFGGGGGGDDFGGGGFGGGLGGGLGGGFGGGIFRRGEEGSMGVIATIMERVQLHDAGGSMLEKYDPMSALDMARLGDEVGVPSITVRAIAMSLGDWNVIAKSFNTTHDVVRVIKRSCGGAINA